jgi:hypothetical protein
MLAYALSPIAKICGGSSPIIFDKEEVEHEWTTRISIL